MSLGAEVIAAVHMNMKVCAINCISAMGADMEAGPTQDAVGENMKDTLPHFRILITGLLESLAE